MADTLNIFGDIFATQQPTKPAAKLRRYRATWPCGSTWEFDRRDLDVPQYENGQQTGLTHCYDTLKDALAYLPSDAGCTVEKIK